jgi:uncharacterized protein YggE
MASQNDAEKHKLRGVVKVSLDLRIVVVVLLLAIAGMLLVWKPWTDAGTSNRTIEVTGATTISATPDEFVFYPSYQFVNADKAAALAEVTKKSNEVVAGLKKVGVADKHIKTNASGYDYPVYDALTQEATYSLQLTVTIDNLGLAQKVQDYLLSTVPIGGLTPQPAFSDAKQKELEAEARGQATKEARTKAEQMAENLGFKIGKVKSVSESQGLQFLPYAATTARDLAASPEASQSLAIEPGENELPYSVTVVYYLR